MPREVHDWTKDKLKILEAYLTGYLGATSKAIERVYIDGFAGPGLNRIKESKELIDGSPLIALKARAKSGTRFSRLIFIEESPKIGGELEESLREVERPGRWEVVIGDVNQKLPEMIQAINRRSPTLVFLDTEGIEPKWSTIAAIAPWQTELLINFPLGMSINRNLTSPKVSDYFGTTDWTSCLRDAHRTKCLLDLYKARLKSVGYSHTTDGDRLIRTQGVSGQQLYYLLFVSKKDIAKNIMNWVFRQPDSRGQSRLPI